MIKKVWNHLKKEGIASIVKYGYRYSLQRITPVIMNTFKVFSKKKRIVFSHFDGKAYGGNPSKICDEIINRGLPYKLIWTTERTYKKSLPKQVKWVPTRSLRQIIAMSTSKIWIDDCRKPSCFRKGIKQYYIQTWHGGGPCLKKIEKDAINLLPKTYIQDAKNDSKMADLLVSGCKWRTNNYKSAFWYTGEILECGTPTSDVYCEKSQDIKTKVFDLYSIEKARRVALFAPTFRSTHNTDCYLMDFEAVIKALKSRFGGDWCLAIRMHPAIMDHSRFIDYTEDIIDVSDYKCFEELLIASDVLITDYSGCMFDAYSLQKSIFIYAVDLEEYQEKERGFYFNLEDLPAQVSRTSEELVKCILDFNEEAYKNKAEKFVESIGYFPYGTATNSIVERIISVMED